MDYNVIQYAGYVVGIISSLYAIHIRRKLFRLQSKSEKARAKSYRAKTKAEEARQAEHTTGAIKNFIDWFRGNKSSSTEGSAQIY